MYTGSSAASSEQFLRAVSLAIVLSETLNKVKSQHLGFVFFCRSTVCPLLFGSMNDNFVCHGTRGVNRQISTNCAETNIFFNLSFFRFGEVGGVEERGGSLLCSISEDGGVVSIPRIFFSTHNH